MLRGWLNWQKEAAMENDGGPAFPRVEPGTGGEGAVIYFGMSLRDYFAAAAMQGMLAHGARSNEKKISDFDAVANDAFGYADAMLAERRK